MNEHLMKLLAYERHQLFLAEAAQYRLQKELSIARRHPNWNIRFVVQWIRTQLVGRKNAQREETDSLLTGNDPNTILLGEEGK